MAHDSAHSLHVVFIVVYHLSIVDTSELGVMRATYLPRLEKTVLSLVSQGWPNREIAGTLFISENTVKIHLGNILEKLHVRNRHQAALLVVQTHMEFEK